MPIQPTPGLPGQTRGSLSSNLMGSKHRQHRPAVVVEWASSHALPLAVALTLLAGTLALAMMVAAHPGPLPADVGLTVWWQHLVLPHRLFTSVVKEVSTVNFPQTATLTIAVIVGVFALFVRRLDMLLALATLAVADGTNFMLNQVIHRPRPGGFGIMVDQHITTDFSFPSGHVEHAVAFLGVVVFLSFQVSHPARWQATLLWSARLFLLICIVLMLPSRVLEGEHWPSDGLAGLLIGGFWLLLAMLAYRWAAQRWPQLLGLGEPRPVSSRSPTFHSAPPRNEEECPDGERRDYVSPAPSSGP